MAVLTAALTRLRSDFNTRFPNRDHTTDGWIGDYAHQQHSSGHNPDDTSGSKAEYSDSDSKAEVRAIDVDTDLRTAGATMQAVVDAILATPKDRDRLRYIIFNRHIWSKSNGWKRASYSGSDPHTGHAHFSGDPNYDESDGPFASVLNFGNEEDDLPTAKEIADAVWGAKFPSPYDGRDLTAEVFLRYTNYRAYVNRDDLAVLNAKADAIAAKAGVDQSELAAIKEAAQAGVAAAADHLADLVAAKLPQADQAAVKEAVKEALREGTGG